MLSDNCSEALAAERSKALCVTFHLKISLLNAIRAALQSAGGHVKGMQAHNGLISRGLCGILSHWLRRALQNAWRPK